MNNPTDAFWAQVDRSGDCWLWTGSVLDGYGVFRAAGQTWRAHRYSLTLAGVETPKDMDVHHTCHVKRCVRPEHLAVLSKRDHAFAHGKGEPHSEDVCANGHAMTPENTYLQKKPQSVKKVCRTCNREKVSRFYKAIRKKPYEGDDHGTRRAYHRGCRCELCKAAQHEFAARRWREKGF